MANWHRRVGITAVGLLVLAALAWGFWPPAVRVETARVLRGPLQVTVDEEGRTRVADRYVVSAPVAGYAQRVSLDVGDEVRKGERLATLTPALAEVLDPRARAAAGARVAAARAAVDGARAGAAAAQAQAEYARAESRRIAQLRTQRLASATEAERAAAEARRAAAALRAARFQVSVAENELEAARTALKYSAATDTGAPAEQVSIRSPIDGRVLKRYRESEGPVKAGEPLLELGDPHALEVEVDVLSEDAVRIAPGTRVLFERWGGDGVLQGVVRTVEPTGFTKVSALGVEEQRVLVIADFTSPPAQWRRLGDGYRVEARFIVWEGSDVLQVPASALFRYQDGWAVFVAEGGRAHRRRVEIGQRNGLRAQVRGGLEAGTMVIVHPADEVDDGSRIEPGAR